MFYCNFDASAELAFAPAAIDSVLTDSFAGDLVALARRKKTCGVNCQRSKPLRRRIVATIAIFLGD